MIQDLINKSLVRNFVEGGQVDFTDMVNLGLLQKNGEAYSLTYLGRNYL